MKDITSPVFSSRARSIETYGRTSSGTHYLLFQKQSFARLGPALPKHFLAIIREGKKAFDK